MSGPLKGGGPDSRLVTAYQREMITELNYLEVKEGSERRVN